MKKFFSLVLALVMALSLTTVAWGADPVEVSDEAGLVAAFENGGTYKLTKSVTVAENTRFVVGKGVSVTLDLGGNTLSSTNTATATHNFLIDVNGGTLTISNGAVEYTHTGTNMGWNGATTAIDVTGGGILNMSDVSVTVSGTDMNFAVHMNNWGSVTLDADNCVFDATYCGVRVFNSGPDMNDVTIKNSTLKGTTRAFWVHCYTSADMGGKVYSGANAAYDESAVLARLDLDIYNNNNTFEITGTAKSPIRYGMTGSVFFTEQGAKVTEVEVSAPTIAPSDELDAAEQELVENVAVSVDAAANDTLSEAANTVADTTTVSAEVLADAMVELGATTTEEIDIVVQPSLDIEITEVVAENTDVVSITLDITPVYQMVATYGSATMVLDEGELEITEPMVITISIPDTLAELATRGKLYVTHVASSGTYIYEAEIAGAAGSYTATFTNPHGFSSFTIGTENNSVAVVDGVNYANLQDAVDAVADGGTITVNVSGLFAIVSEEKTFTVDYEDGVSDATIYPAAGFKMTIDDDEYTVTEGISYSGNVGGSTGTTSGTTTTPSTDKTVTSAETFDAGIALYVGMSVMAAAGAAVILKKKED